MIQTLSDVHQQFAMFFKSRVLQPFAYLLSKNLSEGHICLPLNQIDALQNQISGYFNYPLNVQALQNDALVSTDINRRQPFVIWKNKLYLHKYFYYETIILEKIKVLISHENQDLFKQNLEFLKPNIEKIFNIHTQNKVDWQLIASLMALTHNFNIITGGPGTGKTTTVSKILALLHVQNPNLSVALTAPTGKAATRMAESLKNAAHNFSDSTTSWFNNFEPQTLHRLLMKKGLHNQSDKAEEEWLPYDVIIVDESSMIDISIFAQLLKSIKASGKIIFLGDQNQLSSVEAGSLFGDLCLSVPETNHLTKHKLKCIREIWPDLYLSEIQETESKSILFEHITRLTFSHRFKADEGIGKLSKAILEANELIISSFFANNDKQVEIVKEKKEKTFEEFVLAFADYVHEIDIALALKKLNRYKILCAVREGEAGVIMINKAVEKILSSNGLISINEEFYQNRPIMITQNNYTLGLYNGDIGLVRKDEEGKNKVWFENAKGNLESFYPELLYFSETVFAITIHKSQGSEFNHVYIVLPQVDFNNFLSRELLYTAVTRAKDSVKLESNYETLINAVNKSVKRSSGITDRILEIN